jgi:hypothetical protein
VIPSLVVRGSSAQVKKKEMSANHASERKENPPPTQIDTYRSLWAKGLHPWHTDRQQCWDFPWPRRRSCGNICNATRTSSVFILSPLSMALHESHPAYLPQTKESSNLVRLQDIPAVRTGQKSLGHDRRVMMSDLPLTIFVHIDKRVSGKNLITSGTHCEAVNSCILGPSWSGSEIEVHKSNRFSAKKSCLP